jgi:hypothetical protein
MNTDKKDTLVNTYANSIGASQISIGSAHKHSIPLMLAGSTPCWHGEAGIGKTEVARQTAQAMGVADEHFLPLIVSQLVSSDFMIPFRGEGGYFELMLSKMFQPIFEAGKDGKPSMIFFDEITRYQDAETASFIFSIISDRSIGHRKLPDNCYILSACNPDNGAYQVNDILNDPAWRRRLSHMEVVHDVAEWLGWAKDSGVHTYVVDYVESNVESLLDVPARSAGKLYATPASWVKASNYLKVNGDSALSVVGLSTFIGYDKAVDFVSYTQDSEFKISPATILEDSAKTKEVLDRITAAERKDLVPRMVTSLVIYLYSAKPDPDEVAGPLCWFWGNISEECLVKLATELFNRRPVDVACSYYELLMAAIAKQPLWKNKILGLAKNLMK